MRILSYNIHKGFNFSNTRYLLDEIRHSIRLMQADLVFLQEVVGDNTKNKIAAWTPQQFEYLADEVWPHYAYGKNAIYTHGHHGNAILSKSPFIEYSNIDVSYIPTSRRGILYGKTNYPDSGHKEQKLVLHLICLHFGLFAFERHKQIQQLYEHILHRIPAQEPLIIAGDFNDWRGDSNTTLWELGLKEAFLQRYGQLAKTFPARFPVFAMDRIYYRNIELVDAEVLSGHPWNKLSDHCALFSEFKLK